MELQALVLSITAVFIPNLRELLALLDAASTNEELAIELIQNVHEPTVRDQFHAQTTQRLHNYLAGAHSLRDHVRRLMADSDGADRGGVRAPEGGPMFPHFRGVGLLVLMPVTLKEGGMPSRYPPEFRRKVLELIAAGGRSRR